MERNYVTVVVCIRYAVQSIISSHINVRDEEALPRKILVRPTLPTDVVAANSLVSSFRRLLKRFFLFKQSYHDIVYTGILQLVVLAVVAPLRPL